MNPATACARALVDELARHGVVHVVLAPGSRSAPVALAAHDHPGITLHVRIDERSAGFLALGMAKAAGRPIAAVVCTSGSAAANLAPAVWEASASGTGLLVLTADRPPELRDTGANQTIDQLKLYGSAVRWFFELGVPEAGATGQWRAVASRAVAEAAGASGAAPGPVHLNCPFREPLVPDAGDEAAGVDADAGDAHTGADAGDARAGADAADAVRTGAGAARAGADAGDAGAVADARAGADAGGRPGGAPFTAHTVPEPPPAPPVILERLAAVRRGLVVAGDGSCGADVLAAALGWPLCAEPTSNARRGPHAIATYHLLAAAGFLEAEPPDVVVSIGKLALCKPLLGFLGSGVEHIVIDPHGRWWDPVRSASQVVTAGAAETAGRLEATQADPGFGAAWQAADRAARATLDEVLDAEPAPSEPRLARDVAAHLPAGALLVAASSGPIRDLDVAMASRSDLTVLGNRGASGIDGFVSTAAGAALVHGRPAAALAGDLSLLHDQNGLLLGPEEARPDLVLVVAHNDGGGIFHFLPQASSPAFERVFATPHGVDLADVAAVARVGYARVEGAGGVVGALGEALAAGGIHIVDVPTDRHANVALRGRLVAAVEAVLRR